ncbi:MAG: hypothetical protein ABW224_12530 [Kibdelosporangium sp.]
MRIAFPGCVHRVSLADPGRAMTDLAGLLGEIRPDGQAVLEPLACETVETAVDGGAFMLALVTPADADPALLTAVAVDVPNGWDATGAEGLRDAMEDVGGPDVRETVALDTQAGPAVLAERVPGPEQVRARERLTLQLQGFVVDPDTGRMLLLTLAGPSARGWAKHRELFASMVASARR